MFYSTKFDKVQGDSKKTWKIINKLRGKENCKAKSSFLINDYLVKDRRIIANEFNQYFASIFIINYYINIYNRESTDMFITCQCIAI